MGDSSISTEHQRTPESLAAQPMPATLQSLSVAPTEKNAMFIISDRLVRPTLDLTPAPTRIAVSVEPSTKPYSRRFSRRSRIANPGIAPGVDLHQHKRVHDADEPALVDDPADRFASYYDPNHSVVFQTGIQERMRDSRGQGARANVRRALAAAAKAKTSSRLDGDVVRAVARLAHVVTAASPKSPLSHTSKAPPQVPSEVAALLSQLLRITVEPLRYRFIQRIR